MSSEEITTDIKDFCLFTTNKENLCLCEICLKIIFRRYPMFDKELKKYFIDTIENVISENNIANKYRNLFATFLIFSLFM